MDQQQQIEKQSSSALISVCALAVLGLLAIAFIPGGPKTENSGTKNLAGDEKLNGVVAKILVLNSYECPRVSHIWSEGNSPYGWKLEVLCGPTDQEGSSPSLHYSVYPERMIAVTCKPFGALGGGCN